MEAQLILSRLGKQISSTPLPAASLSPHTRTELGTTLPSPHNLHRETGTEPRATSAHLHSHGSSTGSHPALAALKAERPSSPLRLPSRLPCPKSLTSAAGGGGVWRGKRGPQRQALEGSRHRPYAVKEWRRNDKQRCQSKAGREAAGASAGLACL